MKKNVRRFAGHNSQIRIHTFKELYSNRTLSKPTDGNRTAITTILCVAMMLFLLISLIYGHYTALSTQQMLFMNQGQLLRQTLAITVLMMFLLIDGSPETLALGLFLGCESCADVFSVTLSSMPYENFLVGYFRQMAVVFRLYFGCQMARIASKFLNPWLNWGSVLTILYVLAMEWSVSLREHVATFWGHMTQIAVGILSAAVCCRVAVLIWDKHIPWRVAALSISAVAFLAQPLRILLDVYFDNTAPQHALTAMQLYHELSYFLFMLAALLNMSTIENRVKALSTAKAKKRVERLREESVILSAVAKTTQMLAHDVRKPFSLINAYVESMNRAKTSREAADILRRMIPDMHKSLSMVDQMLHNVMDIGREFPLRFQQIGVRELTAKCLNQVFRLTKNPNISFQYKFNHHGKFLADEQQLIRVFSNILENAEQAIDGRNESITISTFNDASQSGPKICLEINNTGSVIPTADIKNIFDAFFTKGKASGTGLGLAIVKKIVLLHGGKVSVVSNPQSGTTFKFLIPAVLDVIEEDLRLPDRSGEIQAISPAISFDDNTANTDYNQGSRVNSMKESEPLDILIVDDELAYAEAISSAITHILQNQPFKINVYQEPEAAFAALKQDLFHIVICDYNLKSDRYTGIDILRSASNTKTKPVTILHTNHIFAKNVNDQFGDVVQMLMPKPMGQEELQAVIRLAVSQRYATAGASQVALIEDDDIFVENFEHSVKAYAIHTYRTPDEFIKATQSTPLSNYEAVITDYYFTGTQMTGSDVAEFVLRTGQGTVPVLLYSDRNRVDSRFFQGHINKSSAEIETEIRESIQRFKADKDTLK